MRLVLRQLIDTRQLTNSDPRQLASFVHFSAVECFCWVPWKLNRRERGECIIKLRLQVLHTSILFFCLTLFRMCFGVAWPESVVVFKSFTLKESLILEGSLDIASRLEERYTGILVQNIIAIGTRGYIIRSHVQEFSLQQVSNFIKRLNTGYQFYMHS